MGGIFCIVLSTVMLTLGGQIVRIFGLDGTSLELARQYIRGESPFFIVFAIYQVAAATLQGSGDVGFATICTIASLCTRVVLSYLLAFFTPLSYTAIWWAMVSGWAVGLIMAYLRYLCGAWKKKSLVSQ